MVCVAQVVIFKLSQHAMTSGHAASRWWGIRFAKRAAWTNPLMGWLSSSETSVPVQTYARFENMEQAVLWAERNGLAYEVQRDYTRTPGRIDSSYAYNFVPPSVQVRPSAELTCCWSECHENMHSRVTRTVVRAAPSVRDSQSRLERLGPRKARHLFNHDTGKTDLFVNYRRTDWEHHAWQPAASGLSKAAWAGPAWPAAQATTEGGH